MRFAARSRSAGPARPALHFHPLSRPLVPYLWTAADQLSPRPADLLLIFLYRQSDGLSLLQFGQRSLSHLRRLTQCVRPEGGGPIRSTATWVRRIVGIVFVLLGVTQAPVIQRSPALRVVMDVWPKGKE